ncbi:hypothetical protein [Saccharopolyspora spinosa]|uniref:hypothetical protein n=1 Tax=Saccharopolyspora spinosa TaxID=60894 RepID=UPI00030E1463|nr:hypothetical protein [Saccharopolyspora spinosa]
MAALPGEARSESTEDAAGATEDVAGAAENDGDGARSSLGRDGGEVLPPKSRMRKW